MGFPLPSAGRCALRGEQPRLPYLTRRLARRSVNDWREQEQSVAGATLLTSVASTLSHPRNLMVVFFLLCSLVSLGNFCASLIIHAIFSILLAYNTFEVLTTH